MPATEFVRLLTGHIILCEISFSFSMRFYKKTRSVVTVQPVSRDILSYETCQTTIPQEQHEETQILL